ncbi:MAG: ATP-binding cassette domain-containing protein [Pseudomonadota bacterium]
MGVAVELKGCVKRLVSSDSEFWLEVEQVHLEQGEFVGFVGRSGSGKSTFLDLLSLASTPDEIESYILAVDGIKHDLTDLILQSDDEALSAIRLQHFGYILQSGGLIDCLNVKENINLVPSILRSKQLSADSPTVGMLDMDSHMNKRTSQLSGGQRQRVSILRALSGTPTIIVADEPTAAIDEAMADVIIKQLKSLTQLAGVTVSLVSHDLDLVYQYCDTVIEMKPKQIGNNRVLTKIQRIC